MSSPERVAVVSSFVEYTAVFSEPAFGLGENWARLHSAMAHALGPWGLRSRGISFRTNPANLSEVRANYQLPDSRFTFGVGIDSAIASVSNSAWDEVPRFLPAVDAALAAVRETLKISISTQKTALSMHVRAQTKSNLQIVQGLVKTDRLLWPGEQPKDYGLSVQTDHGSYFVEPSLSVPGGLYIGFERRYPGDKPQQEIIEDIRRTEDHVLDALDLALADDSVPTGKSS
jgi:hypothetical protein